MGSGEWREGDNAAGGMVGDAARGGCRPHLYDATVLATTRDTCCPTRGRLHACTKGRHIQTNTYTDGHTYTAGHTI